MTRIRHLNCATMRPRSERFIHGEGSWLARGRMIAHCMLIETDAGLVLVDAGLGLDDCADPVGRLGRTFVDVVAPALDPAETAARQVERLGYQRTDVRHIVLTHMDVDHAGGLPDFPDAEVHLYRDELRAIEDPKGLERERYRRCHWAHGPKWAPHDADGETFMGLTAVKAIVEPEVLLIPTAGHSRGHAAVAVRDGDGWLLHCGDAYFHRHEMREPPSCSPGLSLFQRVVATDNAARLHNQAQLRRLALEEPSVSMFCAHDEHELNGFRD